MLLFGCDQEQQGSGRLGDNEQWRLHNAVIETQWQILLHASLAMSRRILQLLQADRALWTSAEAQYLCQGIVSFDKTAIKVSTSLSHQVRLIASNFKVVGRTQATKSNLQNFRYRCLVAALIDASEALLQTLHACKNYESKKTLKSCQVPSTTD